MKNKNEFSLAFLIMGAFVGGGFASGKEILVYFSKFGYFSIFTSVLFGILFYLLTYNFLMLGFNNNTQFCYEFKISNKAFNFKGLLMICNCVFVGSMLAGIFELSKHFNKPFGLLLIVFTIIILITILFKGLKGLELINYFFMPFLLIILIFIMVCNLSKSIDFVTCNNHFKAISSCFIYISFNILSLSTFYLEVGKNYNKKQIKKCSAVSSTALTLILIIVNLFFSTYYNSVKNYTLPFVSLAGGVNKVLSVFALIVVYAGMLTTLTSTAYTVKQYFESKSNKYLAVTLVVVIGLIISVLGFEQIVGKLYYVLGVIGGVYCIYVISAKLLKQQSLNKSCTKNN